jgi:phosphatidylglycerophosphate synthase
MSDPFERELKSWAMAARRRSPRPKRGRRRVEKVDAVQEAYNLLHLVPDGEVRPFRESARTPPVADPFLDSEHRSARGYRALIRQTSMVVATFGESIRERVRLPAVVFPIMALLAFFVASALIFAEQLLAAAVVLVVAGGLEAIDADAVMRSKHSRRDVMIDYVADRFGDVVLFGSIAVVLARTSPMGAYLSGAVLLVALLSSYCRAQAAALNLVADSVFGRLERLLCLFGGLAGAWVLQVSGGDPADALVAGVAGALCFATATLIERVWSAVTTPPYVEGEVTAWDSKSFLPTIIRQFAGDGRLVVVEHTDRPSDVRTFSQAKIVEINPRADGSASVRIHGRRRSA